MWPADRVVAGLRVCKQLHENLSENVGKVVLEKRAEADIHEDALITDLSRVSHLNVALKWRGLPAGLSMCLELLRTRL
eukprot:3229513-Rhodomonas_salina.1